MKFNHNTVIAALMALAVIGAGGLASAAPGSIDSSATDTTDITYVSDGETISTEFNGSLGDAETFAVPILNATGASADDLAMNVTHDGVEYYKFTGTWDSYASGEADTSTDYVHNFTESDLDRVPVDPNTNHTLNVTYWNQSKDAANRTPTTVTVYVETTDERNVQRATSDSAFVDVETNSPPLYRPLSDDYNSTTVEDEPAINGSNTSVIYTLEGDIVSSPFANSTDDLSNSGTFTLMMADVSGDSDEPVPVFYKSVPDWYDAGEMGSYGVYSPNQNTLTFTLSDENFDGENSADVSATSDVYRSTDIYTVWKLAGGYSGDGVGAITQMVM